MKDFFSKCDPIRKKLLLKKSLMKTLFYAHCSFSAIATFLKSKLCHRSFFQDFCKFVKTQILQKKSLWLLLLSDKDSRQYEHCIKKKNFQDNFQVFSFQSKSMQHVALLVFICQKIQEWSGWQGALNKITDTFKLLKHDFAGP